MKEQYRVKNYVIEKLIVLSIFIAIMCVFAMSYPVNTVIKLEFTILLLLVYFCWRILFFPIDLMKGKKQAIVYFGAHTSGESYLTSHNKVCAMWYCYYGENKHICFLVPVSIPIIKLEDDMWIPNVGEKIAVTYYPITRIMYSVEVIPKES